MDNTLENLLKQDTEFSEAKFKSKVENTFVQIKLSMVTGKTEKIHHFVNEETYQKIVQTGWMAYREADHPVFLQNNSEIIQKKSKSFCYSVSWVLYVRR